MFKDISFVVLLILALSSIALFGYHVKGKADAGIPWFAHGKANYAQECNSNNR